VIFEAYIKIKQILNLFYCFSHYSAAPFYNIWKVILRNPRMFLSTTSHITKTSFILLTSVVNWNI